MPKLGEKVLLGTDFIFLNKYSPFHILVVNLLQSVASVAKRHNVREKGGGGRRRTENQCILKRYVHSIILDPYLG